MVELEALRKEYVASSSSAPPTLAVDDLTLTVERGELLTLLGPSGCGKTTTLRMIAGFEQPTSGRVSVDGRDVTRLPPQKRGIGMVFQNYALFPHLDVADNVAFGLRTRGMRKAEAAERVEAMLRRVELAGYGKRRVQELSGGQQQRVALARALAPEPPLLLLDEPLSNLDAALREKTRVELRSLLKRLGMTAVFVTHDQEEAFALADRIALLDAGRLQQIGTAEELYNEPANAFVASFLGRANFLPAHIRAIATDTVACEIANRAHWQVRRSPALGEVAVRDRVLVMARPESLSIHPLEEKEDPSALDGVVAERRFAGAVTYYVVQTFAGELLIAGGAHEFEPGTRICVRPRGPVYAFPDRREHERPDEPADPDESD
ncbi:MAG: ABC transporter ATP-binding protein [Longimicrobiales bacterium]